MLRVVRERLRASTRAQGLERGAHPSPREARRSADPDVLTIGFARRFATYKRATLLMHDLALARAARADRRPAGAVPVRRQGASGGRARAVDDARDPADLEPAAVHRQDPAARGLRHGISRLLVSGVDVWLNTPVRPFEASGTSGMKAAINGTAEPERARRLVGRGVRRTPGAQERLGHPARGRHCTTRRIATGRTRPRSTRSCRTR